MAKSKSSGTKIIRAGSAYARAITRFIDERWSRSVLAGLLAGRYVIAGGSQRTGNPRKKAR